MEPIARNIIQKLCDINLISHSQVVDGSNLFTIGRQRNIFYIFKQLHHASYFIKQAHDEEPGAKKSLMLEGLFYKLVNDQKESAVLASFLPKYFYFDVATASLFIELMKDSEDAGTHFHRTGYIDSCTLAAIGIATAACHNVPVSALDSIQHLFDSQPHWIFRLQETPSPLPSLRQRSLASAALIDSILANPSFLTLLNDLYNDWNYDTLIHGDHEWGNFLMTNNPNNTVKKTIKFIDWEHVRKGDSAWDIGCGLAAFIIHKAIFLNNREELIGRDYFPLEETTKGMSLFWSSYMNNVIINNKDLVYFSNKCLRMMAARLLVAAYENCYGLDTIPIVSESLVTVASRCLSSEGERIINCFNLNL